MPIGPIDRQPVNGIEDASVVSKASPVETSQAQTVASQPESPTPATLAAQLIQNARAAGDNASIAAPLENLLNAVTAQMDIENLPDEQRQNLAAQLAGDPVVKNLIGR
jgi:hypothetical protein